MIIISYTFEIPEVMLMFAPFSVIVASILYDSAAFSLYTYSSPATITAITTIATVTSLLSRI